MTAQYYFPHFTILTQILCRFNLLLSLSVHGYIFLFEYINNKHFNLKSCLFLRLLCIPHMKHFVSNEVVTQPFSTTVSFHSTHSVDLQSHAQAVTTTTQQQQNTCTQTVKKLPRYPQVERNEMQFLHAT